MSKKYGIALLIIGIMLCGSLVLGTSYSMYQLDAQQQQSNQIAVGCFTLTFEDSGTNSNTYTNISLTNSYPISRQTALTKTPYKFKITNNCDYVAKTTVAVNVLKTSSVSQAAQNAHKTVADYVNIAFQDGNGEVSESMLMSSLPAGTIRTGDNVTQNSYVIIDGIYLEKDASKTYSLWMWVPETINNTPVGNDAQSLTLYSKIDVYSEAVHNDDVPINLYHDNSGASVPELYQGMIPVTYDASGNTVVADPYEEWYDYDEHEWANAVLVSDSSEYFENGELKESKIGTTITSNILQYYVWIPRYKYTLWNAENGSSNEQQIAITFEDKNTTKSTGSTNGTDLTHPAFTFGNTELNGFWVGKFEMTGSISASSLTILPGVSSLRSQYLEDVFNALRNQDIQYSSNYGLDTNEIDTHMMKNMEWGAVAYLSHSKYGRYNTNGTCVSGGCEVWINPNKNYTTGCAGSSVSASSTTSCDQWTTTNGKHASTTDNQYGIYDMSGGAYDYVMGNMKQSNGNFGTSYGALTGALNSRYYNSYNYNSSNTTHDRGLLGDATKETLKTFGNTPGGWYGDESEFPFSSYYWFIRGGSYYDSSKAGVFEFKFYTGAGSGGYYSFRAVLSAQDGNSNTLDGN